MPEHDDLLRRLRDAVARYGEAQRAAAVRGDTEAAEFFRRQKRQAAVGIREVEA